MCCIIQKCIDEVEDSAIAPYGRDLAGYQAIAGPIRRQSDQMELDAGLDIEGEAIRKLQVAILFIKIEFIAKARQFPIR